MARSTADMVESKSAKELPGYKDSEYTEQAVQVPAYRNTDNACTSSNHRRTRSCSRRTAADHRPALLSFLLQIRSLGCSFLDLGFDCVVLHLHRFLVDSGHRCFIFEIESAITFDEPLWCIGDTNLQL